jgi:PPOX class probable F420-dependent enzyme
MSAVYTGTNAVQRQADTLKHVSTPLLFDPATEKYVSLATYRRNGVEVKTPVWIAELARRYYVFSAGDAGKVKRIRAAPNVRLAACDVRGNLRSGWMEGRAKIISDPLLVMEVRKALRGKYGLMMRLTDAVASMTGRIRRRAYIEIELVNS